ncbi:MAG: ABC transporter substrate-binding protein [Actinomycetota bacterium]|nr:ABC transporter substrate-binding protein [Actinomycetota bacterium]
MKRLDPATGSSLLTVGVLAVVGLLLSVAAAIPQEGDTGGSGVLADPGSGADEVVAGDIAAEGQGEGTGVGSTEASGAAGKSSARTASGPASKVASGPTGGAQAVECAKGRNGGSTDVGVTGDSIKLAATVVADGPGASFLAPVRTGMNAVLRKVNARPDGVCGRRLDLVLRNDSWDPDRGQQYIKNFVEGEKVFALAVVPSSEGLRAADDYVRSKSVPVVGTDGMLIHQYLNPWIWPVATSTISAMHIMAKDAHDRGARHFGIVFDAKYHFGVEGAYAYNQAVKRLTGQDIGGYDTSLKSCRLQFCGLQPGKPSYSQEANSFNQDCLASRRECDFVAVLLEPDTAVSFFGAVGTTAVQYGLGGAQPLFNRVLGENCRKACDGMRVWTGYNPPIEDLATQPAVAKYVSDVRAESNSADVTNQFLEGGYVGMSLLVAALDKVGPTLTRNNLKAVLDNMDFDIGLSSPLSWRPGNHFANKAAQSFEIQYKQAFNGWRRTSGFLVDPWVGQDIAEE